MMENRGSAKKKKNIFSSFWLYIETSFGWCRGRTQRQELSKEGKESEKEMEEVIFLFGCGLRK